MIGFDKTSLSENLCVDNRFPAASVFKIVTAAAAIEECGFNSKSTLTYNGEKHTLYKSQLKARKNRYTNRITLRDSFAQSVNPVFGKLGSNYLGKATLEKYASAFGFNREINFEIPIQASVAAISEDPYHWAEIACGFNRETRISPLHGALIASIIVNRGRLIEPTIIDRITDGNGSVLYKTDAVSLSQAISERASRHMGELMAATISSGTSKKAFRGYRNDHILSKLNIGGKTGSINTEDNEARYDWFVGFADEKNGPGELVISVVVAHEKYIGIRASAYAHMAMKHYFRTLFADRGEKREKRGG